MNPTNSVFDAKRLIGRDFSDPTVQKDMKHWPFKVVSDKNKPVIEVEFMGETKRFKPEEISSMVLLKMKVRCIFSILPRYCISDCTLPYFPIPCAHTTAYNTHLSSNNITPRGEMPRFALTAHKAVLMRAPCCFNSHTLPPTHPLTHPLTHPPTHPLCCPRVFAGYCRDVHWREGD
jgi:hypothetical protein